MLNPAKSTTQGAPIIRLTFDGLPPNPNQTVRNHWSKNYQINQEWKQLAGWTAKRAYKGEPFKKAHLHYVISFGDNRAHDADNAVASLKHAQDGLKGIVIEDDSIDHITVSYEFNRNKPRGITLTIEPL